MFLYNRVVKSTKEDKAKLKLLFQYLKHTIDYKRIMGADSLNQLCKCVETTGLYGAGHAVDTMDAISQALLLPVKIYLDEIDKLGNYESILP